MKIGMRSPSLSKSFKARTTGKYKRRAKRAINPLYGKKGVGFAKNPGKSIKSAVYHRTTFGVGDVVKMTSSSSKKLLPPIVPLKEIPVRIRKKNH